MKLREILEQREYETLSPFAMKVAESKGRDREEEKCDLRTEYQRDADRIIGLLEKHDIKDTKLVINKLRPKMVKNGSMLSIEDMLDILAIDLLGVVPDDENIIIAANKGEYVASMDKSQAGQAYRNIAKRLGGEEVELVKMERGFFAKLFSRR